MSDLFTEAAGWYPDAEILRLTTGEEEPEDPSVPRSSICYHITAGSDSRNHLQNVLNGASVHFLIRVENGKAKVYQFISVFKTAYGNGRTSGPTNPFMEQWMKDLLARNKNINKATISIEHEGFYPSSLPFPEVVIVASIKLSKWICKVRPTIIKDRKHLIGHYQVDHIDRANCPGGPGGKLFPFDRFVRELNAAPAPQFVHFKETNQDVPLDFYNKWVEKGGLEVFGYPLLPVGTTDFGGGLILPTQSFERSRFERQKDGTITLGRVEYERLHNLGQI